MRLREKLYELIHKQPYGTEEVVNINEIHIMRDFEVTTPKEWKMERCRKHIKTKGFLDSPITVKIRHNRKWLVDGYTRYLVAKELNLTVIPIKYIK